MEKPLTDGPEVPVARPGNPAISRLTPVVPLLFGAAALLFAYHTSIWALDDSFITYRYAANLEIGNGPVFNVGEHYLGTTAPGFAFWLAFVHWLMISLHLPDVLVSVGHLEPRRADALLDIPHLARYTSALSIFGIALLVYRGLRDALQGAVGLWAGLIAGLWLIFDDSLAKVTGHETLSQVFLILLAFSLWDRHKSLAAVVFGFATLVRPDSLLPFGVGVFALLYGMTRKARTRLPMKEATSQLLAVLLPLVGVLAPWLIFATLYYGSPMPGTLLAKQAQIQVHFGQPVTVASLLMESLGSVPELFGPPIALLAVVGLLCAIINRKFLLPLAWLGLYLLTYQALNVTRWPWYATPVTTGVLALAVYGTANLVLLALAFAHARGLDPGTRVELRLASLSHEGLTFVDTQGLGLSGPFALRTARLASAGLAGCFVFVVLLAAFDAGTRLTGPRIYNAHTDTFIPAARAIRALSPGGATIACIEPGAFAWYLGPKYRVVDVLGLTSPGVAEHRMSLDIVWVYKHYRPDYIYYYASGLQPVQAEPWFWLNYEEAGRFPDPYWQQWGDVPPILYRRAEPWLDSATGLKAAVPAVASRVDDSGTPSAPAGPGMLPVSDWVPEKGEQESSLTVSGRSLTQGPLLHNPLGAYSEVRQTVRVEPGKFYLLSWRYEARDPGSHGRLFVGFPDADGSARRVIPPDTGFLVGPCEAGCQAQYGFAVPQRVDHIELFLRNDGTAPLIWSDLFLQQVAR